MVPIQRIRWLALFIGVIIVLNPNHFASAQPHLNGTPAGDLFQEYSSQYFLDRSIQFSKDMYARESYLAGLTQTIVKEIKSRKKDGSLKPSDLSNHAWGTLPAFTPFDQNKFKDRRISRAYPAWEQSQLEEFFRSMIRVEEIRNQLLESANPTQKHRMFRQEYKYGLHAYADEKWDLAILWFDGIIESYDYRMVDDILFYRSEAYLELGYLYQAFTGYFQIIKDHAESPYWEDSMVRAFTILDELGLPDQMKQLYQKWETRVTKSSPKAQDLINYKLSKIWFLEGDYDQTIYHTTLISSNAADRAYANILMASSWAIKGEYAKAIPGLQEIIADRKTKPDFRNDATLKLAAIYFDMGEYNQCLEIINPIGSNSPYYPKALLVQAWAHFRLDNFHKTVELTSELLKYYPSDESAYEATCLEAYTQQTPIDPEMGKNIFQTVMNDAVKSWKLETAFQERELLFTNLQNAISLEEAVFMEGRRDLFEKYVETRSQLTTLVRRLRILEMWEANEKLHPILTEHREVARVAGELYDLSGSVKESYASSRLNNFINIQDNLGGLHHRLGSLYEMLCLTNPAFLQEYEIQFTQSYSGGLIAKANAELDQLEQSLSSISALTAESEELKKYAARFQLEQEKWQLISSLNELDVQRTELGNMIQETPHTHLEEWAEFSFRRSFMSGGLLNRYSFSQARIDDLNRYLNTINHLLSTQDSAPINTTPDKTGTETPNE